MIDADGEEIIAWFVSSNKICEAEFFPKLLSKVKGEVREFIGDGVYDRRGVYYEAIEKIGGLGVKQGK